MTKSLRWDDFAFKVAHRAVRARARLADALWPTRIEADFKSRDFGQLSFAGARDELEAAAERLLPLSSAAAMTRFLSAWRPGYVEKVVGEADGVTRHIIPLFGVAYDFGKEIKWREDLLSGHTWPRTFFGKLCIINPKDDADIKFPWELCRFQHLVTLGTAFWLTGNEHYAQECVTQIKVWMQDNPPNRGPHWACTMEVAIRAANLIWAFTFLRAAKPVSDEFVKLFLNLLLAHGKYVRCHLENKKRIRGNHYLADLAGLLYIASFCGFFKKSRSWFDFAVAELKREVNEQVLPDGADFEGSIPYHRLVTEMLFHAVYIAAKARSPLADAHEPRKLLPVAMEVFGPVFLRRLELMFEFILHYTRPDGMAPQIGDNDSGRFVVFSSLAQARNDHRHLLAIGGEFFNRNDFRRAGMAAPSDSCWMFGPPRSTPASAEVKVGSKGYPCAGIYVMRHGDDFCLVHCSELGSAGKGAHSHNDNLSFELAVGGSSFLVDPGTYTYSRYPEQRNLFRSTAYHNTLVLDGLEQNGISKGDLFLLEKQSEPRVLRWDSSPEEDIFQGEIEYASPELGRRVHRRTIQFEKQQRQWSIIDEIGGKGKCQMDWFFHFHPRVQVDQQRSFLRLTRGPNVRLTLSFGDEGVWRAEVVASWYSEDYGHREPSRVLHLQQRLRLPCQRRFVFSAEGPLAIPDHSALRHEARAVPRKSGWAEAIADVQRR